MIVLVLPAYNEEANIGRLLARIEEVVPTLAVRLQALIVDDGCSDRTVEVARRFADRVPLEVVTHATNRGLAAAMKTGLGAALVRAVGPHDVIITMDADDTHSPDLLALMLARVVVGADLVIASRFTAGAQVDGLTLARKVYSGVAAWTFRALAPMKGVRDYTCGYRAYRAAFLRRVWSAYGDDITTATGFSCMADILLKCREFDPVVVEVPLHLRYDRKEGASKMDVRKTILDTLRLLLRVVWVRLRGRATN